MDERLLCRLKEITDEERAILAGGQGIQRERYTSGRDFVVDSEKMLEKGKLIEIRPHTRFVHFPRHRHNYVEVLYMCSGSTTHILNGTQRMILHTGDLLFLNQAVYHEILPAAEEDVGVNFIILPQFFDRSFRMLEQENVLRDFLISTLSEASTFAGWLHIAAGDILPVENLLENMIWTLLEKKPGVNQLNQTTMGLLLQNLTLFAENINRTMPESRDENAVFSTLQYIETSYRDGTLEEIAVRIVDEQTEREVLPFVGVIAIRHRPGIRRTGNLLNSLVMKIVVTSITNLRKNMVAVRRSIALRQFVPNEVMPGA